MACHQMIGCLPEVLDETTAELEIVPALQSQLQSTPELTVCILDVLTNFK